MKKRLRIFVIGWLTVSLASWAAGVAGTAAPAESAGSPTKTAQIAQPAAWQALSAALWRIDQGFDSTLQAQSLLETESIEVTPVLYSQEGGELALPSFRLGPGDGCRGRREAADGCRGRTAAGDGGRLQGEAAGRLQGTEWNGVRKLAACEGRVPAFDMILSLAG